MSAAVTLSSRRGFVEAVGARFDAAGIEYAFLHATEESDRDSDVDVVVNHRHLAAVEAVVRSGELGRLVQRFDYDVPWCRYYVLATGEPERPFRQLDVASDPYGISRYGLGLTQALAGARRVDGMSVLRPASVVVYLAAKRARKGVLSPDEEHRLTKAYTDDPLGAEGLLVETWGQAGAAVCDALAGERGLREALSLLGDEISLSRRTPRRLALRARFEARRHVDRLVRPTGLVVQLAGPDGSGKSTMAAALTDRLRGAFRRYERLHFGPGLLPPPARLLGRPPADPSTPHGRAPSGQVGSYVRIAYLAADAIVGWLPRVWAPRARSSLVVLERGWDDLRVDPLRYRVGMGRKLVGLLSRVLPAPDLTMLLVGDPVRIADRKPELTELEIDRQIDTWRSVLRSTRRSSVEIDTTKPAADARAEVAIIDRLACRAGALSDARPALECLGEPAADGSRYSVVPAGRKPRWLLPRRGGAPGPQGAGLYRPASAKHELGARVLGAAQRLGGCGFGSISLDARTGLGPEIAAALGVRDIELACLLPTDPVRRARATFSVLKGGRPVAIVKVGQAASDDLVRERDVLCALAAAETRVLTVPKTLASFAWRGYDVLVTSLVPARGRTDRAVASTERRALVELASLAPYLESSFGPAGERVLVHGDFSAWNSAHHGHGRLALWDWEWARYGLPLEDYFHWQTQRLVHFGRGSVEILVASALRPPPDVVRLCHECNFETRRTPEALAASLRTAISTTAPESVGSELRHEALRLLERRA